MCNITPVQALETASLKNPTKLMRICNRLKSKPQPFRRNLDVNWNLAAREGLLLKMPNETVVGALPCAC